MIRLGIFVAAGLVCASALAADPVQRTLSFEERVKHQTAIEQVYWNHREWPAVNPGPKPALEAALPSDVLRARVENYLKESKALETIWGAPITSSQLQAEMDRMAAHTRNRSLLDELFDALGNDPYVIAETLARQSLAARLIRNRYAFDDRYHGELRRQAEAAVLACSSATCMRAMGGVYRETSWKRETDPAAFEANVSQLTNRLGGTEAALPIGKLSTLEDLRSALSVTSVLSQSEAEVTSAVVVWPKTAFDVWWVPTKAAVSANVEAATGPFSLPMLPSGCLEDQWTQTLSDAPDPATQHTAVWTGTEMIVWSDAENALSRYNPATDTWSLSVGSAGAPRPARYHSAVWTGTEMIVWGGLIGFDALNSGGRYNPSTDSWVATSIGAGVPEGRGAHVAVWSGTRMIVWGGTLRERFEPVNTGGVYDPTTNSWSATSLGEHVPPAMIGRTGIWTGTEMIVWGGYDIDWSTGHPVGRNDGARYDPTTNTWIPTSRGQNVPLPRQGHTAVWTGAEMIIWGGGDDGVNYQTGGRYNPLSDTWIPTSQAGAPSARQLHSAVWTGTKMIVWSGAASVLVTGGGIYDPSAINPWTLIAEGPDAPDRRIYHSAVWTGSEMIVWGGENVYSPYAAMNSGGRFNPSTGTWVRTSSGTVPSGRTSHTAVWTGVEMIVWGGTGNDSSGGRYIPASDSWTPTAMLNAPTIRSQHTAVWTGTEMIVWGGNSLYPYDEPLRDGGRYNSATDTWKPGGTGLGLLSPRYGHTAVWTGDEMIVWGGGNTGDGAKFRPADDSWAPISGVNAPYSRSFHTAVWTGAEMIVWGGSYDSPLFDQDFHNDGGRYQPSTDTWVGIPFSYTAPVARDSHTAVWTGSEMIVWGGKRRYWEGLYAPGGGRYTPATDTWVRTSSAGFEPWYTYGHTAVWAGDEMIVWGGTSGPGAINSGGRYDPSSDTWIPTLMTNAPSARTGHSAIWTGNEMLVWGGDFSNSGGRYILDTALDHDGDGISSCLGDCNDSNGAVYPGAPQVCDGVNNDCADPAWPAVPTDDADADDDGYTTCGGDCDDTRGATHPGAAESCNGIDDDCDNVFDNGGDALCDDANPCTDATCQSSSGCVFTDNAGPCDDGNECTLDDVCSGGGCTGSPLTGESCNDGNACSTGDYCVSGQCSPGAGTVACDDDSVCTYDYCDPASGCIFDTSIAGDLCDDGNPCTINACDPVLFCVFPPAAAGGACDDFDVCTLTDRCDGNGNCVGQSVCDDQNACTDDFAAAPSCVCSHEPSYPGTLCSDGNPCTAGETCDGNGTVTSCVGGTSVNCDDANPCTADFCSPLTGCFHNSTAGSCEDGNPCTSDDACVGGACRPGSPTVCNDGNACTDDSCSPSTGCTVTNNTGACEDGNGCTANDTCSGGFCLPGLPAVCDDGNVCTDDTCSPAIGCVFNGNFNSCDDGNPCTVNDTCGAPATTLVFAESFDGPRPPGLPPGWTSSVAGTGAPWVTRVGSTETPPSSVFGANSSQTADQALASPPIAIATASATLTFRNRWRFDDASNCYDAGVLEIQIGTGAFADVTAAGGRFLSGGYTGTVESGYGNPLAGRTAWCNASQGYPAYVTTSVALPQTAAGETIRLRWRLGSDSSAADTGQDIDSIVITDSTQTCHGGPAADCDDGNPCTTDSCDSAGCVHTNNSNPCNDGNGCTQTDVCAGGTCTGSNPIVCAPLDQCHTAGTCSPATGTCSNPARPDGTVCSDGDLCTGGETCRAGTCTPATSGLNEPKPHSTEYYRLLCQGPSSGDQLTDADAVCVSSVAQTFAGIASVAQLCAELMLDPTSNPCDGAEDQLMALALNICRGRVCTAQEIDSHCGDNGDVAASLAKADAILLSAPTDDASCAEAKCLAEEINTGRALELNSLLVSREGSAVRLTWRPPYLNEGAGLPRHYEVWRRPMGSLSEFTKIGEPIDPSFVDGTAGSGAFQYEVTAVN